MSEIGNFIRTQRKLRGWTLQKLAERCGLSVSFLSQVERGISSPSILSLSTICDALEVPLSDLYKTFNEGNNHSSDLGPSSEIIKNGERSSIQFSSSCIKYQFLSGDFPGRLFEIIIGEIPPDYHYPPSGHEGEEFGYLLQGKLKFIIGKEIHELNTGDSYHFLATTPHGYTTGEKSGATVLWVQSLKYSGWRSRTGDKLSAKGTEAEKSVRMVSN